MVERPAADLVDALAGVPLFGACSPKELRAVARDGKTLRKKAGSSIVTEDAKGIAFFLILDGMVEISRGGRPVARLMPGDFFGESALLSDRPRNATAVAITDVELFTFTQWAFKSMLLGNAKIAYGVASSLAARAAGV